MVAGVMMVPKKWKGKGKRGRGRKGGKRRGRGRQLKGEGERFLMIFPLPLSLPLFRHHHSPCYNMRWRSIQGFHSREEYVLCKQDLAKNDWLSLPLLKPKSYSLAFQLLATSEHDFPLRRYLLAVGLFMLHFCRLTTLVGKDQSIHSCIIQICGLGEGRLVEPLVQ